MNLIKRSSKHPAFMMLEAVMAICVCASAIILTLGFIHTLNADLQTRPSSYQTYKNTLLSPVSSTQMITSLSPAHLTYETQALSYTHTFGETFVFYIPIHIQ